jgi:hypothetical protein
MWLVWLLHDSRNAKLPPRAWPEKQQQYQRVQGKIHKCLARLGSDAHDAMRITRVPGSIHSGASERVRFFVQADYAGCCYSYTLDELSAHFGVRRGRTRRRGIEIPERSISRRSRGPKALTEYRVKVFLRLLELRGGGFDDGCRNHAASTMLGC